jgi:potassium channel subfamily K
MGKEGAEGFEKGGDGKGLENGAEKGVAENRHTNSGGNAVTGEERQTERESGPLMHYSSPWSWVGSRSPLMGSQEEAEWILERLIARLGEELRAAREAHHRSGGQ